MTNDDSYQHVVKTSEQWNERAVEYWVIPRGCLCVELTSKGKTKIKIGEGDKYYHQLPYITDYEELNNYYTKEEVDKLIKNLEFMSIKSSDEYASKNDLPKNGNNRGDVRFVKSASPSIKTDPDTYLWNGSRWILVGAPFQDIDLSDYAKKSEIVPRIESLEKASHSHDNKSILDKITEDSILSDDDREKFDNLHNYDDSELRKMIQESGHTHENKDILDKITAPYTVELDEKLKSLENYDDTNIQDKLREIEESVHTHDNKEVLDNLTQDVIDNSHKHVNQDVLDQITAPFTIKEKEKLDSLNDIGDYFGASEEFDGIHGLVPAALAGNQDKFLRADGTWQDVEGQNYMAGTGIEIVKETDPGTGSESNIINNTGVLSVVQKEDEPNTIVVTDKDGSSEIVIPNDDTQYEAGEGISITSSGGKGKNKFDMFSCVRKDGYGKSSNGSEAAWGDNFGYTTSFTEVLPNTMYTISGNITGYDPKNGTQQLARLYFYTNNDEWIGRTDGFLQSEIPYKFTTPSNCYKLQIQYSILYFDPSTIQIEIGSSATAYEPYKALSRIIDNTGVLDVTSNEGILTISKKSGDKDIDILSELGKLTLNCNNNPD